jgi:LmbE family N-acetylglucosaminyl deacetylase
MAEATKEPTAPKRALVVSAHPDDIEFVVAGTVARWRLAGSDVRYVLGTSGDAGSHVPGMTRAELARIREWEQRAAARVVGVDEVVFLGYHDGIAEPTLDLRRDIVREIRRFRPDALVCFDPTGLFMGDGYINHPDHRAVAQAAIDAVAPAASMPLVFPELRLEGLEPHAVSEIYVTSATPNVWIDITDTLELKIEALRQHMSQFPDGWDPGDMLRAWAAESGAQAGFAYAEGFRRIILHAEDSE